MWLRAHGVVEKDFEDMAREAHAIRRLLEWNPVDLTKEQIFKIYQSAW
ncbi:alcohol dehydrogenase class IV [Pseudorhizobium tarimense]|uniref:Alcohol dehydrogenase class IV n=1 Tax=Pseudorhizobium tarimense TaxID=1079109 RepID=A0ABV2HE87_9HYPH